RKNPTSQQVVKMDTRHILFICGGAFVGLEKIIEKRVRKGAFIGFNNDPQPKEKADYSLFHAAEAEDLMEYGFIPEFIGRLPVKVALNGLGKDEFLRILSEPKNAIVRQYAKLCEMDDCELVFDRSGLEKIVDIALEKKIGARGLRAVFERILRNDMFLLRENAAKRILVTSDYVTRQMALQEESFISELKASAARTDSSNTEKIIAENAAQLDAA
ncbi:MAG: hypothetical protein EOM80_15760, partial [Erysipelotrichia bacterium]|nr:hypothetical protein [Erysipelotrichia bacterium]